MSPTKRLLLALGLIVIAIGLGVAIYFVFFRAAPEVPLPPGALPPGAPSGLPTAGPGVPPTGAPQVVPPVLPVAPEIAQGGPTKTTQLTEVSAKSAVLTSDGRTMAYWNEANGKFYRVTSDGKASLLSDKQFFGVENINWAPGAAKAVLEYPDGANVLFDFNRNEQITLPKHWESFDFSPNGEQIITKSVGINPENRWLVVANADGSQAKAIEALGENQDKVRVAWSPTSEVVAFSATGDARGFDSSEIYLVGQNKENFKSLFVEGRDFRPLWAKDGNRLLYSVYNSQNDYKPTLWVTDARGDGIGANRHSISLNTWADKCTFTDATTVYCAVPTSLPSGAGLQPTLATAPDQIYRVDVTTGAKTLVGAPLEGASISRMSISADGGYLFYTDAQTGILRQMRLR